MTDFLNYATLIPVQFRMLLCHSVPLKRDTSKLRDQGSNPGINSVPQRNEVVGWKMTLLSGAVQP